MLSLTPEQKKPQILKVTIDVTRGCNLNCLYCLQGQKSKDFMSVDMTKRIFRAAEDYGVLEIYLSGAEITMHPSFRELLQATHTLKKTNSVAVTNGVLLNDRHIQYIRESNLKRICLSLDGPDRETHNYTRGDSFDKAMRGLRLLQNSGIPITVISVANKHNFTRLIELSRLLAENHLATQHHIVAVSKAGFAKNIYDALKLSTENIEYIQNDINLFVKNSILSEKLHVIFTSYTLATGKVASSREGRSLTLFELSERLKNSNLVVSNSGEVFTTADTWAREFSRSFSLGSVVNENFNDILLKAELFHNSLEARQLSRASEALKKYDLCVTQGQTSSSLPIIDLVKFSKQYKPLSANSLRILKSTLEKRSQEFVLLKTIDKNMFVLFDQRMSYVHFLEKNDLKSVSLL